MAKSFNIPLNYVERDVQRSVKDLSCRRLTSLFSCLHVPIFSEDMIPDDVFKSRVSTALLSNPFQTPYFGRFKFRVSCFQAPLTNYYGWMDNNTRLSSQAIKSMPHWTISPCRPAFLSVSKLGVTFKDMFPGYDGYRVYASALPGNHQEDGDTEYGDASTDAVFINSALVSDDSQFKVYYDNFCVQPGSLLDYFGFPPGYMYSRFSRNKQPSVGTSGWSFNADVVLAYLDIIRSYALNEQLDYIPYFVPGNMKYDLSLDVTDVNNERLFGRRKDAVEINMPISALDDFFIWLRSKREPGDLVFELCKDLVDKYNFAEPTEYGEYLSSFYYHILRWLFNLRFGGMFHVRYENDLLQNLLTNIDSLDSFVQIVDGKISVNDLRQSTRDALENDRLAISGGRYKDVIRVLWGARSRVSLDRPNFIHTYSFYVDPQGVVSNSDTEQTVNGSQVGSALGQMSAYVSTNDDGRKRKRCRVSTADQSVFMYVVSLQPEVSYSRGIGKGLMRTHFADDYKPQYARLGFQDVPDLRYNAVPQVTSNTVHEILTNVKDPISVGKEVAWAPYMTNVDRSHGLFAPGQSLDTFAPNRIYFERQDPNDSFALSPRMDFEPNGYASPQHWNFMFQVVDTSYPNWHLMLKVDLTAFRPIGNRYMPTIE